MEAYLTNASIIQETTADHSWILTPGELTTRMDIEETASINIPPDQLPSSPLEAFELFFPIPIQQNIIERTNQNYLLKVQSKSNPTKRDKTWKALNHIEFRKYIGITLMMGIDTKPEIDMHWQTHGMWTSNLIQTTMSRDKYALINCYLDLGDKSDKDPFGRVRKISDGIQEASMRIYKPRSSLAIDESMIGFEGRHSLKQYMPRKPTKWGFKAFLLCESATGFCLKHKFFSGPGKEEFKTMNLCLDLCSGFENGNHHIYMDNYYTSFELFEQLHDRGIGCTGTLRKHKVSMIVKNIEKDEEKIYFYKRNNVTICLFKDKKIVKLASNMHSNNIVIKEVNAEPFPLMLAKYRANMIGVDVFDRRIVTYAYAHRAQKWWKYLFMYLLEMAITNSYFVFLEINKNQKKPSYIEYRLQLIRQLTQFDERKSQKEEEKRLESFRGEVGHGMAILPKTRKCNYCKSLGVKSNAKYECIICKVPLHQKCFILLHNSNS